MIFDYQYLKLALLLHHYHQLSFLLLSGQTQYQKILHSLFSFLPSPLFVNTSPDRHPPPQSAALA